MAIDLMIMPLSRYFTGDFVTPAMREAWKMGVPYSIVTPAREPRRLPPDVPFGGADAAAERRAALPVLIENLRGLPQGIPDRLWDEDSDQEPVFHRLDVGSYQALCQEIAKASRPSFAGRLMGRSARTLHFLEATLFLPVPFSECFVTAGVRTGSIHTLRGELDGLLCSDEARTAHAAWLAAVRDAIRMRQPLIVDM